MKTSMRLLNSLNSISQKKLRTTFITACVILLSTSLYHVYFAKRIIPGVVVGNTKVGGKNYEQAKSALETSLNASPKKLALSYESKSYELTAEDLGLEYDIDASLSRAYEIGRTGNILIDTKDKMAGILKPLHIKAFYLFSDEALNNELNIIKGEINIDAIDASFVVNDKDSAKIELSPSRTGKKVDADKLYASVVYAFERLDFAAKKISVEEEHPKVLEEVLIPLKPLPKFFFAKKIKQTKKHDLNPALNKTWDLSKEQLLSFITVSMDNSGKIEGLTLDKTEFEGYIELLSRDVNQLPRGKVTSTDGDRVTGFEVLSEGKELDGRKFSDDFKKVLLEGIKENRDIRDSDKQAPEKTADAQETITQNYAIELAMKAPAEPTTKEKYGIFSLLGTGKSKFEGSIPGRIHNLTLAADQTNGILVAPGAIYSFNNTVGEISGATGYDTAYIISNGRTILGEGGGVCQTSTTMFRAALNSGLPIVKRYPHAYRVHYYEEESPVGIDASVFQPSLDFQFKNDTPNYILIQTWYNISTYDLEFKIYGTPDGREVKISEPVVTGYTPAPEALYQDDPTLAKGVIRQIDFSAPGASVYFTREVTRNGQVIISDTFTSRYQAWRAVFLRGTRE